MEFKDGDAIEGRYGNRYQRSNGQWESETGYTYSDDTMSWLLALDTPTPAVIWYDQKLSKTGPQTPELFIHRWRLV